MKAVYLRLLVKLSDLISVSNVSENGCMSYNKDNNNYYYYY